MTKFTKLLIGTAATASLIVNAGVGGLLLTGDVVTDSASNSAPSQVLGTGSYLTFQQAIFAQTGGQVNYNVASISLPSNYSSGGSLHRAQVECATAPLSVTYDVGVVTSSTLSGSNIINNGATTTGSLALHNPVSATPIKISNGNLIKVSMLTDPTDLDCVLKAWTSELYRP